MAIVEMQKLGICARKTNRKQILETLQNLGVMEIAAQDVPEDGLKKMDTAAQSLQFQKECDNLENAITILEQVAPEKKSLLSSLEGKKPVTRADFDATVETQDRLREDARRIVQKEKELAENRAAIARNENQKIALTPWSTLDVPVGFIGTEKTAAFIGTVPGAFDTASFTQELAEALEETPFDATVLSTQGDLSCVSILCLKKDAEKMQDVLRVKGFAKPSFTMEVTPREAMADLDEESAALEERNRELTEELIADGYLRGDLQTLCDYYRNRAEKYRILGTIPQSESAFFLEGWIPKDKADTVAAYLTEHCGAVVEKEEIREDEEVPVLLRNNKFSQSVEGVLSSYGLPVKGKVDPTVIMSAFYVFFFGMMFSDAGYGLIMMLGCGIVLLKFGKTLSEGLSKMIRLFFFCGISTTFWGFMYGSFFGDAIDVIAKTFFGYQGALPILKPLWFEPMKQPMRLLVWCMLFGLIHLFFGLGIKGYEYLKEKDIVGFVSDILSWYLFIIGLILLLLPSDLFGSIAGDAFNFRPLASLNMLAKILTIAGLVLIIVMQERGHKNWVLRILLGAYDVYGVTGWLSDVLSYSRLLALGLATGVIAQVINMMASIKGGGVLGLILFVVIFIAGHLLNFAINVLGAYVHTNRLQFVEFFGKFYEGGGRPFEAFQTANKYTEIKEEHGS